MLITRIAGSIDLNANKTDVVSFFFNIPFTTHSMVGFKNSIISEKQSRVTELLRWSYTLVWVYVYVNVRRQKCVRTPTCQTARPLQSSSGVELVGDLVLVGSVVSCQSFRRQSGIAPYA